MRTLDEAYTEIKQLDPNTAITKYYLRQLMLTGKVRCVMVGTTRRLVDLDSVLEYLSNPTAAQTEQPCNGKIRPIYEKIGGKGA